MLRSHLRVLVVCGAAAVAVHAAGLLPDTYYQVAKTDVHSVAPPDQALFEEYGFDQSEQATYGKLTVTSWRFRDTTGALAGFQYLRPAAAKKCDFAQVAVCAPGEAMVALGNYVLDFKGALPKDTEVNLFLYHAPKFEKAPLPTLMGFLPDQGMVPNSERYVLGPVGLLRFGPSIPPSAAAFNLSSEAEYAKYKESKGETGLLLFSYPTPEIARQQADVLSKVSGAIVKRTGPLVAVVPGPADPDDAARLLARVRYEAAVTMNELPARNQAVGWAKALLSMFALAGIILLFCIVSGLLFGGYKVLSRRWRPAGDGEEMITLHLGGK